MRSTREPVGRGRELSAATIFAAAPPASLTYAAACAHTLRMPASEEHRRGFSRALGLACLYLICCGVVARGATIKDAADGAGQAPIQQAGQRPVEAGPVAAEEPAQQTDDARHKIQPPTPPPDKSAPDDEAGRKHLGFRWKAALKQSFLLLTTERGVDLLFEADTRANLRGPFLKDYFRSVANLHGWRDGDPTATNYLSHPLNGALAGFIQVQNDPTGMDKKFNWSRSYWKSRLRAMGWAAAYSTFFEIGPWTSEAMIGNVGLPPKYRPPGSIPKPPNGGMGYVDMVITPTVGTAWLVSEDIIDRYVIRKLEKRTSNTFLRASLRAFLNPARASANMARVQTPWHRDSRGEPPPGSVVGER